MFINMNKIDSITRDSRILIDSVKDSVSNNLLNSIKQGNLDLSEAQLSKVIMLVNLSADEGYQRAIGVFQNTLKKYTIE